MLKIKIETKNAAFENQTFEECARILDEAVTKLRDGYDEIVLYDLNGNKVGYCKLTKR
jgi:hypothetical protein